MGGDVTGKVVVPMVVDNGQVVAELYGQPERAGTPEEVAELENRIRANGMYPHLMSPEEVQRVADADRGGARGVVRRGDAASRSSAG